MKYQVRLKKQKARFMRTPEYLKHKRLNLIRVLKGEKEIEYVEPKLRLRPQGYGFAKIRQFRLQVKNRHITPRLLRHFRLVRRTTYPKHRLIKKARRYLRLITTKPIGENSRNDLRYSRNGRRQFAYRFRQVRSRTRRRRSKLGSRLVRSRYNYSLNYILPEPKRPNKRFELTLSAVKNNFWATISNVETGHTLHRASAGRFPVCRGSQRSKPFAAVSVAKWGADLLLTQLQLDYEFDPPLFFGRKPPRVQVLEASDFNNLFPTMRYVRLKFKNWSRDRRWRIVTKVLYEALETFSVSGMRIEHLVYPAYSHNGMRPSKARRV